MKRTLFDKIWDAHVVADLEGGYQLVHIDRHLLHDLGAPTSLRAMQKRGLPVRNPALTFATADHCVSSAPGRDEQTNTFGARLIRVLADGCRKENITYFDLAGPDQGIVHVIGPELGLSLPGATIVCGDSHTCTHGALGALAWGIGNSEVNHVLATQCLIERKPSTLRLTFTGDRAAGVTAKDMILYAIARHGAAAGAGHATEFAGDAVTRLTMEQRMTLCNLAIEMGSRIGMIAPDDTTFEYVSGRRYAPRGDRWEAALAQWRALASDDEAVFATELAVDVTAIAPQVSWGTSPEHTIGVDEAIPDPASAPDAVTAAAWRDALTYMGLQPRQPIAGLPIDHVFIGSCTNSRLSDLESAAAVARRGKVATGVTAWVVPGSRRVRREAEALGLHRIFLDAGFEWREPGCSQCVASNGEYVAPGQRCVSTSNRNFTGRQGPNARTHLASPATAALAAITGRISDVRALA